MDVRETTIYFALLIAAIIIGAILGYFLLSIVRMHRRYIRLHRSRSEAQILLLEKEHKRIAADLHDELGPILSAAKFKITEVEPPSHEDRELLTQANDHINNIIIRIREISNGLMPNTLLRKGPMHAIEEFIQAMHSTFSFKIELLPYTVPLLSQQQAINIYSILKEIIHNTHKHAKATRLKIQLFRQADRLVIITTDDGIGFNPKKMAKENPGLGLQNLLLRTEMLGATMFLDTKKGKGTKIIIEIPVKNKTTNTDENKHSH